jgi:hypothetical protein
MRNIEKKYRHEYKYPISDIEAEIIKQRLKGIMPLDAHVDSSGMYLISSLYFDDYYDSCYFENENGTDPREKFRIRIYNHSSIRISLECKRKERTKTLKTSCKLNKEQVEDILHGVPLKCDAKTDPLILKFTNLQKSRGLRPKTIVEYRRVPYVYKMGNVRVTLDSELSSSTYVDRFLVYDYPTRPVMPVGKLLMEVKYDEFLPDYLYDILQLNNLTQTAFSKYYLCRQYDLQKVRR